MLLKVGHNGIKDIVNVRLAIGLPEGTVSIQSQYNTRHKKTHTMLLEHIMRD